jgi:hypothetical protein
VKYFWAGLAALVVLIVAWIVSNYIKAQNALMAAQQTTATTTGFLNLGSGTAGVSIPGLGVLNLSGLGSLFSGSSSSSSGTSGLPPLPADSSTLPPLPPIPDDDLDDDSLDSDLYDSDFPDDF